MSSFVSLPMAWVAAAVAVERVAVVAQQVVLVKAVRHLWRS